MTSDNNVFVKVLHAAISIFIRSPLICLILLAGITGALGYYFVGNFKINSERESLISDRADYRKDWEAFQKEFPVYKQSMIILIRAEDDQKASEGAQKLYDELVTFDGKFTSIFSPTSEPFFSRQCSALYGPGASRSNADQP